jgi:nitrogen PTS system EIIA component
MEIGELVTPAHVIADLRATDKRRVLQDLSHRAATALELKPAQVFDAVLARELLGSTGVGQGTAIPHARLADVHAPFGLLARLDQPISFDAIDGEPVDLILLLLLPDKGQKEQLNALACVSKRFRDKALLARLRAADNPHLLHRLLTTT